MGQKINTQKTKTVIPPALMAIEITVFIWSEILLFIRGGFQLYKQSYRHGNNLSCIQ
jgi:hypothetical protein